MTDEYRIMQASYSSYYIERFTTNSWGLFPKWRPLQMYNFGGNVTINFTTKEQAKNYAREHHEFRNGPKVVE